MDLRDIANRWVPLWDPRARNYRTIQLSKRFRITAALSVFFYLLYAVWPTDEPAPAPDEPAKAWIQIGYLVLSIGLSLLAGALLAREADSPVKDDKPTTLTTRGSFCSWHIGVRSLGPIFCWAGDRETRKEKVPGGGKGGGSDPEQDIYYEAGLHVLGVGPMQGMKRIIQQGKTIFNGPITPQSHPSGTSVDLGKEGVFTIFWGENNQPINTFLGAGSRLGVSSRWPHFCYVVWNKKRLSTSPQWPILQYVMERQPQDHTAALPSSPGWYEPVYTATGNTDVVVDALASASPDNGYLEVSGDRSARYKPGDTVGVSGAGFSDGNYEVRDSDVVQVQTGTGFQGFPVFATRTRIFLEEGTAGATGSGTVADFDPDDSDGANIAHIFYEMLFAPYPLGLGKSPLGPIEDWDINSLDELGAEGDTSGWRSSVISTDGETVESLLGNMLQDHGCMLPIDTQTGQLKWQRVREPSGTLPNLADEIYAEELPEIEVNHAERPVDKLIFSFKDRAQNFGDMTLAIDEDGQASYLNHQRAREVKIVSTVNFDTAGALSELRSQEELAGGGEFRLDASRGARELLPGEAIIAEGFDEVLRVTGVEFDPLSERTKLTVIPDFYGARVTDFQNETGGGQPVISDPENDAQFAAIEVPEQLNPGVQSLLIARIRANAAIESAGVHLSRDDVTYTLNTTDLNVQAGGTLTAELSADTPTFVDQSVSYTEQGPDDSAVLQDLSADLTNWGLGRQLAVIVSTAGIEICFLQRATIVAANERRLDGLLRARYDTRKLTHPAGSQVYIVNFDASTIVTDPLLEPGEDLYVKTQPATSGGSVSIASVGPFGQNLTGKGVVPIDPDYVHVRAPYTNVPAYTTGDDVTVGVALSTAVSLTTGAGLQSSGSPIADPTIPGTVTFELLTTGNALRDTKSGTELQQTWTNAEIIAALGGETSFKIRATHVANGYSSDPVELTITKL